jgi:hypothetical protein
VARILYWNINNFSLNKIADPSDFADSVDRRTHIVNEVFVPSQADLFVIVEVHTRQGEVGLEGVPIVGNAQSGVNQLLRHIRNATHAQWMLVPPVWSGNLGFCEGVAVFYDSNVLRFAGPYAYGPDYRTATKTRSGAWHGPPKQRACPLAQTARPVGAPTTPEWLDGPQDYPALYWAGRLPHRLVGGGPQYEDQVAGQYEFYDADMQRIYFPNQQSRSPFLTHFVEVAAPHKRIKLFTIHTSPGTAEDAVGQLQHIPGLAAGMNEVSVVLGDFNVDIFDSRATYDGLTGLGFTLHFDSKVGGAGPIVPARRPYCMTHFLPTPHATPFRTPGGGVPDPTHNVYPRFGYMGSMGGRLFQTPVSAGAIDNVLTHYGGGAVVPANHNLTIVNTVVGKPYNAVMPAVVTAELIGGLSFASSMATAIPLPQGNDPAALTAVADLATFVLWNNFGLIRSTSDHLALAVDV